MPFDPDAYLSGSQTAAVAPPPSFDPDAYLTQPQAQPAFDPDQYLGIKPPSLTPASDQAASDTGDPFGPGPGNEPAWAKATRERTQAFVQGLGVPTSLQEAKDFLLRSPVQDVRDIAAGIAEIPGKVANIGQTLATSPAATVVRAPLSPEAFGVYGTAAGMLAPGIHEKLKGEPVRPEAAPPAEAVPPSPAETLAPQPERPLAPESAVPSAPATQLAPEVPLPQAEPITAAEQAPTVAEPAPTVAQPEVAAVQEQQARTREWQQRIEALRQQQNVDSLAESIYNDALKRSTGPGPKDVQAESLLAKEKPVMQVATADRTALAAIDRAHEMATQIAEANHGELLPENRPSRYVQTEEPVSPPAAPVAETTRAEPTPSPTAAEPAPEPAAAEASPRGAEPPQGGAPTTEGPIAKLPPPETPGVQPPPVSGINNERLYQIHGEDAIIAGKGRSASAWKQIGQADTRDPYAVLENARKQGIATPADVANLRTEHQRLLNDARNAYGTPQYGELAKRAVDMANAIKGVAHGPASDVFRALQEQDIPRYESPADFDNIIRERMNRESTPTETATFKKITDDVAARNGEAVKAANDAQVKLRKSRPRAAKEPMKFEDAAEYIRKQLVDLTKDCGL